MTEEEPLNSIKDPSPKESQNPVDGNENEAEVNSAKEISTMLKSLHKYTEMDWTPERQELWDEFVQQRWEFALKTFESQGFSETQASKLVRRGWARFDSDNKALVVEKLRSSTPKSVVPILEVHVDGRYEIDPVIHDYLEVHPALPGFSEGPRKREKRTEFMQIFEEVEALEERLGLGYKGLWYLGDIIPDEDSVGRRAADCGYYAHQMLHLLDPGNSGNGHDENLAWLTSGKEGTRFWDLLTTAFELGKALEGRRILDDQGGEYAIRRSIAQPPGKRPSPIGCAIETLIEKYRVEQGTLPTPTELLDWLGGSRPHNTAEPLQIENDLWKGELRKVCWSQFQESVKDAKRRMKRA